MIKLIATDMDGTFLDSSKDFLWSFLIFLRNSEKRILNL